MTSEAWCAFDLGDLYDDLSRRRMQQTQRRKGGGARSRAEVTFKVGFVSTFIRAVGLFFDVRDRNGAAATAHETPIGADHAADPSGRELGARLLQLPSCAY